MLNLISEYFLLSRIVNIWNNHIVSARNVKRFINNICFVMSCMYLLIYLN